MGLPRVAGVFQQEQNSAAVLTSGWALLVPTIWSSYVTRVEREYVLFCHLHLTLNAWTGLVFLKVMISQWTGSKSRPWELGTKRRRRVLVLLVYHGFIKGRLFSEICVWVAITSALAVAALDNAPLVIFLPTNPHHVSSRDSMLNFKSTSGIFSQLVC